MSQPATPRPIRPRSARLPMLAVAVVVALAALAGSAAAGQSPHAASKAGTSRMVTRTVAKKMRNTTLGEVVLVSLKNRTLYTLSSETHGKFFCTAGCLSIWPPLIVGKNVKPAGPTALGRIKRPDGRFQVTFKGRPLYNYGGDTAAGQANGEGLTLGQGTWHAASLEKITAQPAPQPEQPPSPYPY